MCSNIFNNGEFVSKGRISTRTNTRANFYTINRKGFIFRYYEILQDNKLLYRVDLEGLLIIKIQMINVQASETLLIKKKMSFIKMAFEIYRNNNKIAFVNLEDKIQIDKTKNFREPLCVILPGDMHEMEEKFLNQFK